MEQASYKTKNVVSWLLDNLHHRFDHVIVQTRTNRIVCTFNVEMTVCEPPNSHPILPVLTDPSAVLNYRPLYTVRRGLLVQYLQGCQRTAHTYYVDTRI